MCGRYVSVKSDGDVLSDFEAIDATEDERYEADWNIAPTDPVRVVLSRPPKAADGPGIAESDRPIRQLRTVRWGLVPSWSKDRKGAARIIGSSGIEWHDAREARKESLSGERGGVEVMPNSLG